MSQIRFENVNYIYSGGTTFEKQALKDVSFAVYELLGTEMADIRFYGMRRRKEG